MQTFFDSFLDLYADNTNIALFHASMDAGTKRNEVIKVSELQERYTKGAFANEENVYFAPNGLGWRGKSGLWRSKKHMETLECLYADIDLKDSYLDLDPEEALVYLQENVFGCTLPLPTLCVNSGHGLHVYWKIKPLHYKNNIDIWYTLQDYIYEELKRFGADSVVRKDTVRILRVPGSWNCKKDKLKVKCESLYFSGNIYDLNELIEEYDLHKELEAYTKDNIRIIRNKRDREYLQAMKEKYEQSKSKKPGTKRAESTYREKLRLKSGFGSSEKAECGAYTRLYIARMKDIAHLVLSREKGHCIERCCFMFRYYHLMVYGNKELAASKMLELLDQAGIEYDKETIIKETASAEKYADGEILCGGEDVQYRHLNMTADTLASFLDVKADELKHLDAVISTEERKERKSMKNKEFYARKLEQNGKKTKKEQVTERQIKVATLLSQGKNNAEIAEILEISKRTVINDKKTIDTETWQNEYNKRVQEAIAEVGTIEDNISIIAMYDMKIEQIRAYCEQICEHVTDNGEIGETRMNTG